MRTLGATLLLYSALCLCGACMAREATMHKYTAEEIKTACSKVGGQFSQETDAYGCGTNCRGGPGTDCVVDCKTGQPCFAQVIGSRHPTTLLNALQAPAHSAH